MKCENVEGHPEMQISVKIENAGSADLFVTVRDLKAGVTPPVLPPTLLAAKGPELAICVLADERGNGKIRWTAQDTNGVESGQDTVDVKNDDTVRVDS